MLAIFLSVLIFDEPQPFTHFLPEVFSGSESKYVSLPHNQNTPFMLQYEWKLNRDEVAVSAVPSNRETWTEFALVLKPKLPTQIKRTHKRPSASSGFSRIRGRDYPWCNNLWNYILVTRYPFQQHDDHSAFYDLTREPDSLHPHYEGAINSYPPITARAKTIEALEAKLLEMYCDYITQMVEEDTLQAINNANANNPLERAPRGRLDIPDIQFGY